MKDLLENLILGVLIGVAIIGSFWYGRKTAPQLPIEEKTDTLYLRDTITIRVPKVVERRVVDSIPYPVTDTLVVVLPLEQIRWEDSLSVVWASGVNVNVDSVRHFAETKVITQTITQTIKERPRWSLGITGGYGAGKDGLTPFVGVGISWNFLSW